MNPEEFWKGAPDSLRQQIEEMAKWGKDDPSFKYERRIREVAYVPGAKPEVKIEYSPRTQRYYATHARYLDTPAGTGKTPEEAVSDLRNQLANWPVTSALDGFFRLAK